MDVKSRLESIARIGLLKKNDPEVAYGIWPLKPKINGFTPI